LDIAVNWNILRLYLHPETHAASSATLPASDIVTWGLKILMPLRSGLRVGVALDKIELKDAKSQAGWYFDLFDGKLYSEISYCNSVYYSQYSRVGEGATILVEVNRGKGEISFVVNRKKCGVAFQGLNLQQNLAAVVISGSDSSVVFIESN